MDLNKVQVAALRLMQSDARFLYTLVDIHKNAENITSNYIMMCQPYIGIFVDGAEQWCKKVGLVPPSFTAEEKVYYTALRQVIILQISKFKLLRYFFNEIFFNKYCYIIYNTENGE